MAHTKSTTSIASFFVSLACLPSLAGCPAVPGEGGDEIGQTDTDSSEGEAETDTGTDTMTEVPLCEQYCAAWTPCYTEQPGPSCIEECYVELARQPAGMCTTNEIALFECLATLSCEEHEEFLWPEDDDYPCKAEEYASCLCSQSSAEAHPGETASDCTLIYECVGETIYRVDCVESGCICSVDGVQTASCTQAEAVCGGIVGEGFKFAEFVGCCGFVL